MSGGGNAQNHVPAHHQTGVPVLGVQGQGGHDQGQDNAQNVPPQQAGNGAGNHGIHEQQVLSVWGDLTETQEDRNMLQYNLNNMDTVIPGKWS